MTTVEVGSKWVYRGRVLTVLEVAARPEHGPDTYVLAVPERTPAQRHRIGLRGQATHHWTDWMPVRTLDRHATPLLDGEVAEIPVAAPSIREEAEKEAKRRTSLTPRKRLQNRITSARYKLKHPEKNGRSEWSAPERREIEETIQTAQAELEALPKEER